jgi:hypothetical protein
MCSDSSGHSIIPACIIVGAVIGGIVGGGVLGGLVGWGIGAAITTIGAAATGAAGTVAAPIVEKAAEKASTALQTYYPPNNGFSGAIENIIGCWNDYPTNMGSCGEIYSSRRHPKSDAFSSL